MLSFQLCEENISKSISSLKNNYSLLFICISTFRDIFVIKSVINQITNVNQFIFTIQYRSTVIDTRVDVAVLIEI